MGANDELQAHTCEKILQEYGNVVNNVVQANSQHLTEQWRNGQLESFRWYYVKFKTGEIDICWLTEWSNDELGTGGQYFDGIEDSNILEVLAPVPSYEEWQKTFHYASKYEHESTCCAMDYENLKQENQQLRKWCEEFNALDVAKENQQLKELLISAKEIIEWYSTESGYIDLPTNDLLTKIDNATGEK